jgi:hypothetical protein
MKRILTILFLLASAASFGQKHVYFGPPNTIDSFNLTMWVRQFKMPTTPLISPYWDSAGSVYLNVPQETIYFHNGLVWQPISGGGGGGGLQHPGPWLIQRGDTVDLDSASRVAYTLAGATDLRLPTAKAVSDTLPYYAKTSALADSVSGRVPYRNANDSVLLGEYPIRAGQFNLDLTPTAPTVVGGMYWDVTNVCPSIPLNADVTLQVGQEVYVRARNNTGVTISNGKVVYINSAQGNNPTLALADADDVNTSQVIGVATEDISDNATGFVTVTGVVNGVNTSGYNAGDALYLDTINGGLTKQLLSSPHNVVFVGYALNSTNNGRIFVRPSSPIAADTTMDATGNQIAPTQEAVKKYVVNTLDDSMTVVRDSLTDIRSELNGKGNGTVTSIQVVGGTGATVTPTTAVTTSGVYTVTPEVSSATYNTLTNKRITYRTGGAASYTTSVTIAADSVDMFVITAQAGALLFNAPSGTPTQGQMLLIRIKDNGTARALTWNAIWRSGDVTLPTTTTINKTLYMEFLYNTTDSKWDIVGKSDNY